MAQWKVVMMGLKTFNLDEKSEQILKELGKSFNKSEFVNNSIHQLGSTNYLKQCTRELQDQIDRNLEIIRLREKYLKEKPIGESENIKDMIELNPMFWNRLVNKKSSAQSKNKEFNKAYCLDYMLDDFLKLIEEAEPILEKMIKDKKINKYIPELDKSGDLYD